MLSFVFLFFFIAIDLRNMISWNYGNLGADNSIINLHTYCEGNHPWQNFQNVPESELCAPTQSYLWNVCCGKNGHFYGCAYISYRPSTPYYDGSTFSCEVNRNKKPGDAGLKEIKDLLKCLLEQNNEKQLQIERQHATIRNLEAQLSQVVGAVNAQQANIRDSSQEEHEFEMLIKEVRVEYHQPSQLQFEDVNVEEVRLESAKDFDDTNFVDSSIIDIEDVVSPEVHMFERIGPHSKYFFTLGLDDDMEIESSEPLEESRNEEQGAYNLEFFLPERQDCIPHLKAKKCKIVQWLLRPIRFVPPPLDHSRKLDSKLGVQFISSRWRQKVICVVPRH